MALFQIFKRQQRLGDYEVLDRIGVGGTAKVYKGRHRETGRPVAIKLLYPDLVVDPRILQRFEREFAAARRLQHPHVTEVLDFGREGSSHYLVMEYVDGPNLWDYIQSKGRLPEAEAIAIIVQISQALHQAHELGLIHRDVKPDNILLTSDGQAKLCDLGIVKDLDSELGLTRTRQELGTVNFSSVEQFRDSKHVDARTDIYALGATLYMAVTGKIPFEGRSITAVLSRKLKNDLTPARQLVPTLQPRTERAISRAVRADPAERQGSCLEFVAELTSVAPGKPKAAVAASEPTVAAAANGHRMSPRERRAGVRYPSELCSLCQPELGEEGYRWSARVQDVSANGIALVINRRFEPGTILHIELGATQESASRTLRARVVWLKPSGRKKWLVGCELADQLSDSQARNLQE